MLFQQLKEKRQTESLSSNDVFKFEHESQLMEGIIGKLLLNKIIIPIMALQYLVQASFSVK